jgi:acetolactate synthase-1/3 small subunit
MLHTFVALVSDKPGVLTRVASLFRRLNINIVSLTVGESERPETSRMTIVCEAPETAAHRIRASLYKLEITIDVDEVGRSEAVIRELCLIKVAAGPKTRSAIFELANVFRARVVDLAPESIMLEMTGAASKIEGLLQVLKESDYEILEVSRTGRMAMRRGHHTTKVLKALGTPTRDNFTSHDHPAQPDYPNKPDPESILPNEFPNVHEEEEYSDEPDEYDITEAAEEHNADHGEEA